MQIIERNAFRILGLSVTASDRDVARREEELQAHLTIGQPPTFDTDFPWIGNIDRSEESVRRALQVLNDPSLKLEHSLFWFWEYTAEDILAMDSLREGNQAQASIIWNRAIDESGLTHGTLTHFKNLSILSLIQAFRSPIFDQTKFINSIENWGKVLSSKHLINRLTLLHPQLKGDMENDRLGDVVGNCIYSSTKRYLSQWIHESGCGKVAACLAAFSKGGFSQEFQLRITRVITVPILERIESLCGEVSNGQSQDMNCLFESTTRFHQEVSPLLEQLRELLPESDPTLEHYCDKVGHIVRNNAVEYGNNTHNWAESQELCELASQIVMSPMSKETIQDDLEVTSKNVADQRTYGELQPITSTPSLGTFNGIGTMLYGNSNYDPNTDSYETTLYFVVLFISLFPLSRYRVIRKGDRYSFLGKLPFRWGEKLHVGLFLAAVVLILSLGVCSGKSDYTYQNHSNHTPSYSSAPSSPTQKNPLGYRAGSIFDTTSKVAASLESEIEADRKRLKSYESNLETIGSELDSYEAQMKSLDVEIKAAESRLRRGAYVNESVYQSNIETYNSLVKKYNSKSEEGQNLGEKYTRLLKTVSEKIDRYNRLIGAK